jgi:hypothetical protein
MVLDEEIGVLPIIENKCTKNSTRRSANVVERRQVAPFFVSEPT